MRLQRIAASILVSLLGMAVAVPNTVAQGVPSLPDKAEYRVMRDLLEGVSAEVPQFGGLFVEPETNSLRVFVKGKADEVRLERALVTAFGQDIIPPGGVEVVPGEFTIAELSRWYAVMKETAFSVEGVIGTSLSEGRNRLFVAVENEGVVEEVREALMGVSIPMDMVLIEVTGPIGGFASLRDPVRPMHGGVELYNPSVNTSTSGGCTCEC